MKKLVISIFLAASFCGFGKLHSQERFDSIPPSGKEIVRQGIELYDNGKYEGAIEYFKKVNPCDPNYEWACYESALTYDRQRNYTTALEKCQEAITFKPHDIIRLVLKGSILDELGRTGEAIKWLEPLEKKYPYNQNLLYNMAICHLNNGDPQKAESILLRGLLYNPYHAASHLALGKINHIMGRMAQSYLAYNMAIVMNPRIEYIKNLEAAISGESDSICKSYQYPYPVDFKHSKWDDLTALLNAEVAFKDDFKYDFKLNFMSYRQTYLLFQKMEFDKNDSTLYNQFYVRFFKKMFDDNQFETFINYSLKRTDNKTVKEWLEKNKPAVDEFVKKADEFIDYAKEFGFSTLNEEMHQKVIHSSENGKVESIGVLRVTPAPHKEGVWRFIGENGGVVREGSFKNDKKDGEHLIYWPDGAVKQRLNYKDDHLEGLNYAFHPNGSQSGIYPRKNGVTDGSEEEFNSARKLVSRYFYKNGEIEGNSFYVNYEKGFNRETPFVRNKRVGTMTEKWLNGSKKAEALYGDSILNGSYKKWYSNGFPEWEGNYVKDIQVGKWTSYYGNGVKKAEGTYDQTGNPTGVYTAFDHAGNINEQISGYKNGKPNGIQTYYFPNGKERSRIIIEEDKIKHVDCFNLSGEKLYTSDEKDSTLIYKYFHPEGSIKLEGKYKNGLKQGVWKDYYVNGNIAEENNLKDGYLTGVQKSYYLNGKLNLIYSCDTGKIAGKVIKYFQNGHISFTGYYKGNESFGDWTSYYSNDSIASRAYFLNGKIAGRRISYSPAGKLISEETFNDEGEQTAVKYFNGEGKIVDELNFPYDSLSLVVHFPNGRLKAKFSIIDRLNNGLRENYFPNGQLKSRQTSLYNKLQGLYQEWDHHGNPVDSRNYSMNELDGQIYSYENGKILGIDPFQLGVNQGVYKEYHPNGHIFRTITEEDGVRQGNAYFFAPDSSRMYSLQYIDDVAYSVSYRDKQGKLHSGEPIGNGIKEVVCYYENGKVSARLAFAKGVFHGKHIIYYPNGQILRELNYVNDIREGLSKYYFENGVTKESTQWRNGSRDGPSVLYYANGKKALEGANIANKKEGKWLVYNESGKIIETLYYSDDDLYEIN